LVQEGVACEEGASVVRGNCSVVLDITHTTYILLRHCSLPAGSNITVICFCILYQVSFVIRNGISNKTESICCTQSFTKSNVVMWKIVLEMLKFFKTCTKSIPVRLHCT